jgi:peptidoglycan/xylan/chitin deacetylase (PgdA/CDA1 family)
MANHEAINPTYGQYGPRRGIHHILDSLVQHRIQASIMVYGVLAERYPETVRAIANAGHEIVGHSYGMDIVPVALDEATERENALRTGNLIEQACRVRPEGWISPRGTSSSHTSRLLAEFGYRWHGDFLDDDLPYIIQFGSRSIVAFPLAMDASDLPLLIRHGNSPKAMIDVVRETLEGLRNVLLEQAVKIDVTIHAHVFGRPS